MKLLSCHTIYLTLLLVFSIQISFEKSFTNAVKISNRVKSSNKVDDPYVIKNSSFFMEIVTGKTLKHQQKLFGNRGKQQNNLRKIVLACNQNELSKFELNVAKAADGWKNTKKANLFHGIKAGKFVFSLYFRLRNKSSDIQKACSIVKAYRISMFKLLNAYRKYHDKAFYIRKTKFYSGKTLINKVSFNRKFSFLKTMVYGSKLFRNPFLAHNVKPYKKRATKFTSKKFKQRLTERSIVIEKQKSKFPRTRKIRAFIACKTFQRENFRLFVMSKLRMQTKRFSLNYAIRIYYVCFIKNLILFCYNII